MILVTGGTGFVGRGVVAELTAHGHRVRVLSRRRASDALPEGAEHYAGDVTDPAALRAAVSGCSAVVHLVAIRRQWGERTFEAVTAGGTRNVVAAAKGEGVQRFVHISALGPIKNPDTGYMLAKAAAEAAVRESGIPFVILRPSFVIGPGGFVQEYARLIMRAPLVPIPGPGDFPVQPLARADLASAVRRSLEVPAALGRTYEAAGPERMTFEGFIDLIMAAMGVRKGKVHVPLFLMRAMAAVLERLTPNPPATLDEIRMLMAGSFGDPRPMMRDLGIGLLPPAAAVAEAAARLADGLGEEP